MDSNNPNRAWVDHRLALLQPPQEWNPDAEAAYQRFRSSPPKRSRNWMWAAAAAAVIIAAFLTLPAGRAIAQRLWDLVTLKRVEVVRVNFDDLPADVQASLTPRITTNHGYLEPAAGINEASQRVGFTVRLPGANVLPGAPKLSTFGSFAAELILDVDTLERALRRTGADDVRVPREWNGGRLAVQAGAVAVVEYPDITLMQSRPFAMSVPANVSLSAVTEVALRILGINAVQSKRLAERMGSNPAWFLGIPHDDPAGIRDVTLRTGVGTLIHSLEDDGSVQRTELIWSTPDRLYVLSGNMTDQLAIAVANSLD